jgi:hypothetical protein
MKMFNDDNLLLCLIIKIRIFTLPKSATKFYYILKVLILQRHYVGLIGKRINM